MKLTGKAMTVSGEWMTWAGTRLDRAGDNFTAAAITWILLITVLAIAVIACCELISHLT
jgi:uncharacterized membrane protein